MKLRQEQVDKLREGKATLVADHSKLEMMDKVLKEAFPSDKVDVSDYTVWKYFAKGSHNSEIWDVFNDEETIVGELIPLVDFFYSEEHSIIQEPEKTPYQPKTAEERDQLVTEYKNKLTELDAMEFKDMKYWRENAEEDYITTPISVLKYIGKLEEIEQVKHLIN